VPKLNPDDLMELIKGRRSIRQWLDRPVEEEKIKAIITAGIYAPIACNFQATRFYIIRDRTMIAAIARNVSSWFEEIYPPVILVKGDSK